MNPQSKTKSWRYLEWVFIPWVASNVLFSSKYTLFSWIWADSFDLMFTESSTGSFHFDSKSNLRKTKWHTLFGFDRFLCFFSLTCVRTGWRNFFVALLILSFTHQKWECTCWDNRISASFFVAKKNKKKQKYSQISFLYFNSTLLFVAE